MINFLEKNKRYVMAFYLITAWIGLVLFKIEIPKELELTISGTIGLLIGSAFQQSGTKKD